MVHRSLDAGINLFDTAAYANGQSEVMLGQALGPCRKDVVISTKIGFRSGEAVIQAGASYAYLLAAAEASLLRLATDYIDLLSIHKPDPFTPFEETARALDNLVQRGLVHYAGYSNLSAWQSAKFIGIQERHNYARFVAAPMYYSLVGCDLEHEIVPFCVDAGIGIAVWSPLAGGFLTGRYNRKDPTGGKGRLESFDFLPHDRNKGYDLIAKMKIVADRHRATVAQVALGWLLANPTLPPSCWAPARWRNWTTTSAPLTSSCRREKCPNSTRQPRPRRSIPTGFTSVLWMREYATPSGRDCRLAGVKRRYSWRGRSNSRKPFLGGESQ